MNLKQLITDEDAVSPVIGVILMVAITVILAAVIGTFVLGLGENVQDSAPQANFQFEYENAPDGIQDNDVVVITHTGGEDVNADNIDILTGSNTVYTGGALVREHDGTADFELADTPVFSGTVSTGSSARFEESGSGSVFNPGDTIRVIWTSPSGGTSNTIGQSTMPE